ncbi:hypothetical protein [Allisonella histaminiformans]|uniref:hypothetical protein n=1 Tax=Allisonella histaminiformans TaxID=209880 RepID=UPI00351F8FD5
MRMKKAASLFFLITALTASVASASVQTGSIQKINLDLKYPLVYTQNQTAQKKINQDIATWVYNSKRDYDNGEFLSVETQYEVTYEDDSVISIMFVNLSYPAGVAHQWTSYDGIVYDKRTGNRIPLYNYVHIRNAQQLEDGLYSGVLSLHDESGEEITYDGTNWPVERVSQDYLLRGGGTIDLLYSPYELAPFAAGATSIRFDPEAINYFNRMNS